MPEIFEHIEKFRTSDLIGGASPFDWPKIGMLSPSTLHYVKVLTDLIQLFDSMNDERIVEIGCGYGGQCKIISDVFNFKQYTLVDLPEVVLLIRKYLNTQNIPIIDRIRALPMEELPDETYDLVISNYAFTECDTSIQDVYIEKILNKSTHGYITCNFVSEACGIHSYPKDELLSKIKQPWQILPEIPLPYEGNFLLVW